MKKIIVTILAFCMMLQTCAFVAAEESKVLFELVSEDTPAGPLREIAKDASGDNTITVVEDPKTEKKHVEVVDSTLSSTVGFTTPSLPLSGITTTSFKLRIPSGSWQSYGPVFYIGMALTINFDGSIKYYDGSQYITTAGKISKDQIVAISLVVNGSGGTFSLYVDGTKVVDNAPLRNNSKITGNSSIIVAGPNYNTGVMRFNIYDFKVQTGEIIPTISEDNPNMLNPERMLVDFSDAKARLDAALGNAVAMTIGNSVARVNNKYVNIDPGNVYVAPFITPDGYTLVPTRFTAETIGATVEVVSSTCFRFSKDGTVMEINMGDKNAIINGVPKEMPTTPVIKNERLFIPLRFAAETFGKKVFWDDRGLIIISDGSVVSEGQEDIIKPLINDIRQKTTIAGNEKYSDVSFSVREIRPDGHKVNTTTPQLGSFDAVKRFMATRNVWSYVISGNSNKTLRDLGYLNQGTINGQFRDASYEQSVVAFDGKPIYRADGLGKTDGGSNWGCVNDPAYYENLLMRAKTGIDNGMISWQFDDWATNIMYYNWGSFKGCYCDKCMVAFTKYIMEVADPETVAKTGISDFTGFNYKEYLKSIGVVTNHETTTHDNKALISLWVNFERYCVANFHKSLIEDLEEYAGCKLFYSLNSGDSLSSYIGASEYSFINNVVSGKMGETAGGYTTAAALYADMLFSRAIGIKDVISPLPKTTTDKLNMYAGTAMCYATGQQMVVAWDDYLSNTKRYYATLEEMDHIYELPREYPFLFDNYEVPDLIGYVYDLDTMGGLMSIGKDMLDKSVPARAVVSQSGQAKFEITKEDLAGLMAVVVEPEVLNGLPAEEKAVLETSGVPLITTDDTASVSWLENTYRMVTNNNVNVATVLRQNRLYDNAPTIVHAVNYNQNPQEKVEININNLYLPEGDTFNVNVYRPGENYETIKVKKGEGATIITLDSLKRWTVLEICGPTTVRREVKFDLGEGYNGIGLGARISNDKAYGTLDNFTIVTYSEGLNSTVFGDTTGSQDEAAYVYKRLGLGRLKNASVQAGFEAEKGSYGVMVRDGIYSNARHVSLMYDAENGLRLARRIVANKGTIYDNLGTKKPNYMKLERNGSEWMAFVSDDGQNFEKVASVTMDFEETIGGVFATSPDGRRTECRVKELSASPGGYGNESFVRFKISYPGGTIERYTYGEKLDIQLETKNFTDLTTNDVNVMFKSSDENVLKVSSDGTITPTGVGTATITATAYMNLKKIDSSCSITITPVDKVMWEEDFSEGTLPSYMSKDNDAIKVIDGVYTALTETNGTESNIYCTVPLRNLPTVFEFDFRAKFGTESPTTGVRVLYANSTSVSLTADKGGFYWFFGGSQDRIAPIEENKWYHIKIEVDYDNQQANIYIDGEKIVSAAEGRSGFSPSGSMQIGGWRLGTDSVYEWDNFNVYFVEP